MKVCVRVAFLLACVASLCAMALAQDRIIKPDDKVRLVCEEEPSLTKDYTITKDGLIVLSFIGAVEVQGLTEKQAADKISAKLLEQRILKKATITVSLTVPEGKTIRYSGAVKASGEVPPKDGMRLSDLILVAAPTDAADLERVEITTAVGDKIVINFKQFDGTKMEFNPALRPGDSVFFPIRSKPLEVYVFGGVGKPGSVPLVAGMKIRAAIEAAGGFAPLADRTKVRIEREGASPQMLDLTLNTVDLDLQPGDRIIVEISQERQYVFLSGEVARPGTVVYTEGMTLSKAIKDAGGPTNSADIAKISLATKASKTVYTYNLNQINQGYAGDVPLAPGDQIMVPKKSGRRTNPLMIAAGVVFMIFFISR